MLALIRPTQALGLFRMYNNVECWTVAPYHVYLPAMPALRLFVDGPHLPITDVCAVITFIIKEYPIHRGLAHSRVR